MSSPSPLNTTALTMCSARPLARIDEAGQTNTGSIMGTLLWLCVTLALMLMLRKLAELMASMPHHARPAIP
jgi:hypothetical protein